MLALQRPALACDACMLTILCFMAFAFRWTKGKTGVRMISIIARPPCGAPEARTDERLQSTLQPCACNASAGDVCAVKRRRIGRQAAPRRRCAEDRHRNCAAATLLHVTCGSCKQSSRCSGAGQPSGRALLRSCWGRTRRGTPACGLASKARCSWACLQGVRHQSTSCQHRPQRP